MSKRELGRHEVVKGEDLTVSFLLCTINPNDQDFDEVELRNFCDTVVDYIKRFLVVYKGNKVYRKDIPVDECLDREPECEYGLERGDVHNMLHAHINVRCICKTRIGCLHIDKERINRYAKQHLGSAAYVNITQIKQSSRPYNYPRKVSKQK